MNDKELHKFAQSLKDEYDDYNQSVEGLFIFASVVKFSADSGDYFADSKMKIPAKFYVKGDTTKTAITPDGVVQRIAKDAIVAEMKKHFNDDDGEDFDQIKKYDNCLIDYWTDEELPYQDLILLTHYTSGPRALDAYKIWNTNNSYDRNFAIVVFSYSSMGTLVYTLELKEGKLTNEELSEALRKIIKIPHAVILDIKSKFKFYDSQPPTIYTMQVIYDHLLPTMFDDSDADILSKGLLEISIVDIRNRLQDLFNSKEFNLQKNSIPKLPWIKDAFDKFVEIELAKRIDDDKYLIKMVRYKEDTKDFIARRIYKSQTKKKVSTKKAEPTLFDTQSAEGK